MKILSNFALLFAALIAVTLCIARSCDSALVFQHSLDAGKTWTTRGVVDAANMEIDQSAYPAKWTKDELLQLRALAQKKGIASVAESSLLARIAELDQSSGGEVDVHASVAVSPCALVVPRQYTSQLTYIAERYGLTVAGSGSPRVTSMRLLTPFNDEVCEPTVFKVSGDDGVKLKISVVKAAPMKAMPFPYGSDDSANVHNGGSFPSGKSSQNDGRGNDNAKNSNEQAPPQQEQSFWDKWGTYIMIFVAVQAISGFLAPKEAPAGAKGGKGAAAAAEAK